IRKLSLDIISTYWPSTQENTPDLLEFAIIKGLHKYHLLPIILRLLLITHPKYIQTEQTIYITI
ncbi:unnamed protein product, partial [Heterotrigona itama]